MGNEKRKARRMSTAQEIASMTNSMDDVMTSLTGILEATTKRASQPESMNTDALAIKAIEKQEGLSRTQVADAATAILNNPRMSNIYLQMEDEEARREFLLKQIEKV